MLEEKIYVNKLNLQNEDIKKLIEKYATAYNVEPKDVKYLLTRKLSDTSKALIEQNFKKVIPDGSI